MTQHHHKNGQRYGTTTTTTTALLPLFSTAKNNDDDDNWNDNDHIAHGLREVQLETDEDLQEAETAAAWDAHDCADAGMEAAAEERAVMWAARLTEQLKKQQAQPPPQEPKKMP